MRKQYDTGMTNLSSTQIRKVKNKRQAKKEQSRNRLGKAEMATIVASYLHTSGNYGQRVLTSNSNPEEDINSQRNDDAARSDQLETS